jgi:hypothetical protein
MKAAGIPQHRKASEERGVSSQEGRGDGAADHRRAQEEGGDCGTDCGWKERGWHSEAIRLLDFYHRVQASDMTDFLRANKNHFENSENFRLSLKEAAAFEFIKAAAEEYPDQFFTISLPSQLAPLLGPAGWPSLAIVF